MVDAQPIGESRKQQGRRHVSGAELAKQEAGDVAQSSGEGANYCQDSKPGSKREGAPTASSSSSHDSVSKHSREQQLLSEFLKVQERRAGLYSALQSGFTDYLKTGSELSFQQLCGRITAAFNDCSRQVLDIQAALRGPDIGRQDLADMFQDVQTQEKQNLKMTATLQVLRKAGRPSERAHAHANKRGHHQCSHSHEEESALELAESDAEYDAAYKEATRALQESRTAIHEYMEEVRYELASSGVV